jgi:hypothetical protein
MMGGMFGLGLLLIHLPVMTTLELTASVKESITSAQSLQALAKTPLQEPAVSTVSRTVGERSRLAVAMTLSEATAEDMA